MAEIDPIVNLESKYAERQEKKKPKKKKNSKFEVADMQFPAIILNIGKCGRGKSHLTRYLLQYFTLKKPVFSGGIVFSGSLGLNDDYAFLPEKHVFANYSDEILKKYLEHLHKKREQLGTKMPHTFIVFDDLLGKLQGSQFFLNFISTYRHYNVTIFVNNQYLASAASGTQLRELTTYLFAFQTSTHRTISCLYEWYGGDCGSLADFKKMFAEKTPDHHSAMLFIDKEEDIDRKFISFKAPEFTAVKINY